jgi:AraC-like DNA-binding protein
MQALYKQTLVVAVCLLLASLLLAALCIERSYLRAELLPGRGSTLPWHPAANTDAQRGGKSRVLFHPGSERLRFELQVMTGAEYPFAAADLFFEDRAGKPAHVDLSRYDTMVFHARCAPANTLMLSVPTFDATVSKRDDPASYRSPLAFFSCNQRPARIEIDLTRLETAQWWFDLYKQNLSRQAYKLDQVPKISFGTTFQSPADSRADIEIGELVLTGRDDRYLFALGGILISGWGGFAIWFFRRHSAALVADVKDKLQKDLPFVAYQQLSLEPHRDREKSTLLGYIGAHYANAELDVERVVTATGVNRNKLNDILKAELGYTFSGYLNKLRLTEAARLLADQGNSTVAEIAYSVGYANPSYFNKLFKEEYGCTPKAFRAACRETSPVPLPEN